jgi:hypothetical protein
MVKLHPVSQCVSLRGVRRGQRASPRTHDGQQLSKPWSPLCVTTSNAVVLNGLVNGDWLRWLLAHVDDQDHENRHDEQAQHEACEERAQVPASLPDVSRDVESSHASSTGVKMVLVGSAGPRSDALRSAHGRAPRRANDREGTCSLLGAFALKREEAQSVRRWSALRAERTGNPL